VKEKAKNNPIELVSIRNITINMDCEDLKPPTESADLFTEKT